MEEKTKEKQIIKGEVDYDLDRFGAEVYKAALTCDLFEGEAERLASDVMDHVIQDIGFYLFQYESDIDLETIQSYVEYELKKLDSEVAEVYRITKAAENCLDYQSQQKYKAQQEKGNKSGYFYGEV